MILTTSFRPLECTKCGKEYNFSVPLFATEQECFIAYNLCRECREIIQPERSKREDSQKCEMRCSEHCGNTVRDK